MAVHLLRKLSYTLVLLAFRRVKRHRAAARRLLPVAFACVEKQRHAEGGLPEGADSGGGGRLSVSIIMELKSLEKLRIRGFRASKRIGQPEELEKSSCYRSVYPPPDNSKNEIRESGTQEGEGPEGEGNQNLNNSNSNSVFELNQCHKQEDVLQSVSEKMERKTSSDGKKVKTFTRDSDIHRYYYCTRGSGIIYCKNKGLPFRLDSQDRGHSLGIGDNDPPPGPGPQY